MFQPFGLPYPPGEVSNSEIAKILIMVAVLGAAPSRRKSAHARNLNQQGAASPGCGPRPTSRSLISLTAQLELAGKSPSLHEHPHLHLHT
jgi:hypothetical protein